MSISQGQLVDPTLCQLTLHGLHPRLARRGMGQLLLSMAGYEQQQYTVVGEFMGDLPFHYASQSAAAGVGNAVACLIYIRAPPLDAQLLRLPRSFLIGDEKVHISLPGQRGNLKDLQHALYRLCKYTQSNHGSKLHPSKIVCIVDVHSIYIYFTGRNSTHQSLVPVASSWQS